MTKQVRKLPIRLMMRFSDPLIEQRFLPFYEGFYRSYAQASLVLGMILVVGDWLVDHLVFPNVPANEYRIVLSVPILGLGLALSFSRVGKRYWQPLMAAVIVLVGLSLYWTLYRIDLQGGSGLASWVGILNFTFFELYCFVILGIGFRYALPTGFLLFLGFEVSILTALTHEIEHGSYLTYHVFTVFLLAAMIGWWREYLLRKEFLALVELEKATQVAQSQAEYLSEHDAVTGLHNLTGFIAVLDRKMHAAIDQHRTLPLLLIDLERLRRVRDAFSQKTADELVRSLVHRLRESSILFQPSPEFARVSSFEIAVLFRHVQETAMVIEASERLLDALRQPFQLRGQDFYLQPNGGLSMYPNDGDSAEATLKAARAALAMHANEGRFLHFYNADRDSALVKRLQLEEDLRVALAGGQLSLAYQPLIRVSDRAPLGVEALLRWTHPSSGLIVPAEFIPIMEELGLIHEVGEWVLNKACEQAVRWQQSGIMLNEIAINVSGLQLADPGFAGKVSSALTRSGLHPRILVLELTESVLVHDNDAAMAQLSALKNLGLRLSLDDFGTGFASMMSLARFPFDIIKLDRSFVQAAPSSRVAAAIVEAIMALATRLRMATIAEGIETGEQLQYISALKCDFAQGYLFSRPCSANEVALLLTSNRLSSGVSNGHDIELTG
ncbi:bifunctional diguanylate cyclase/phosphodiesterase [Rhodoferax sp. U11-2br]|uniref:putative bifunctional diguanylate cyclase/phosphodiesterase n=1 Tax=Rhodoferax sp. U11-2br TaxID=2838878 RepID=UPI001BE9EE19|nr:bifunctional diguanylate cyclase/phosphodiesterase [Rhodoferax sp. U11-2br]MBT3067878.1 bifunctional diguanylate cyclase/phosphodiesterase [Rhodoferax sp. U11-2br]